MIGIAISTTHVTTTTPNTSPDKDVRSIRKICREGILAGRTTKEITAEIVALHPSSRAAALPGKHIAWYRGDMKKRGELPAPA